MEEEEKEVHLSKIQKNNNLESTAVFFHSVYINPAILSLECKAMPDPTLTPIVWRCATKCGVWTVFRGR